VSQTAPLLLSTPERTWGATAVLNPAYIPAGEIFSVQEVSLLLSIE
jgi:hypothetical protein